MSRKKEDQDQEDEEFYTEPVRTGISEIIRKANWGPLVFYSGLAVVASVLLLMFGFWLGPPFQYILLGLMVLIDLMCFLNAKAYGWPGGIITESCELVGFRRVFLKYPDGRERMNEGNLFYDFSIGEDGLLTMEKLGQHTESKDNKTKTLLKEAFKDLIRLNEKDGKKGGIMKLHLKSSYGRGSSSIMVVYLPEHIFRIKSTILPLLVSPIEKLTANNSEWTSFAGTFYNPISTPSEDQFIFLKEAPRVASFLVDLIKSDELEADNEALRIKVEAQETRIQKLLKVRDDLRMEDEAAEEAGGIPKKWYQVTTVRLFLELVIMWGLSMAFVWLAGQWFFGG